MDFHISLQAPGNKKFIVTFYTFLLLAEQMLDKLSHQQPVVLLFLLPSSLQESQDHICTLACPALKCVLRIQTQISIFALLPLKHCPSPCHIFGIKLVLQHMVGPYGPELQDLYNYSFANSQTLPQLHTYFIHLAISG